MTTASVNGAPQRVLLLHGPLLLSGINPVTQSLYQDGEARERARSVFNSDQTILALATAYRARGFKIAYSGWSEDAEWLQANRSAFDYLVVSEQSQLRGHSDFLGVRIVNNKEKLYFSALRGMRLVREHAGGEALVFRLRSDVSVDPGCAIADLERVRPGSGILLVEYLNTNRTFWMPDFMLMGRADALLAIYEHLYRLSAADQCYHVSSHVDHCMTYLHLIEEGGLREIQCMSRATFDSVVWRGVPRYLEASFLDNAQGLFFNGGVQIERAVALAQLRALTAGKAA